MGRDDNGLVRALINSQDQSLGLRIYLQFDRWIVLVELVKFLVFIDSHDIRLALRGEINPVFNVDPRGR